MGFLVFRRFALTFTLVVSLAAPGNAQTVQAEKSQPASAGVSALARAALPGPHEWKCPLAGGAADGDSLLVVSECCEAMLLSGRSNQVTAVPLAGSPGRCASVDMADGIILVLEEDRRHARLHTLQGDLTRRVGLSTSVPVSRCRLWSGLVACTVGLGDDGVLLFSYQGQLVRRVRKPVGDKGDGGAARVFNVDLVRDGERLLVFDLWDYKLYEVGTGPSLMLLSEKQPHPYFVDKQARRAAAKHQDAPGTLLFDGCALSATAERGRVVILHIARDWTGDQEIAVGPVDSLLWSASWKIPRELGYPFSSLVSWRGGFVLIPPDRGQPVFVEVMQ